MLWEAIQYLSTPCNADIRQVGFLTGAIGIQARYRRCRKAWKPHLKRTQEAIKADVMRCKETRTALILGSGSLYDIPLAFLAKQFDRVILLDVVHTWRARIMACRYSNVSCETIDITHTLPLLCSPPEALPTPPTPQNYLDDESIDYVASVNLLSQLSIYPYELLTEAGRFSHKAIEHFCQQLIKQHMSYLERFSCPVTLVTDTDMELRHVTNHSIQKEDLLYGYTLPAAHDSWYWDIAPAPEVHKHHHVAHQVAWIQLDKI